jgi:hypothetical protein
MDEQVVQTVLFGHAGGGPSSGYASRAPLPARRRFCWMGAQAITADVSGLRWRRMVDERGETEGVLVPGERH